LEGKTARREVERVGLGKVRERGARESGERARERVSVCLVVSSL
jgi:hypothetical protein